MLTAIYNYVNVNGSTKKQYTYGYSIPQLLLYIAAATFLLLLFTYGVSGVIRTVKVYVARFDEMMLQSAAATYQVYNSNNEIPSSSSDLVTGYGADEATDGMEHKNLIWAFNLNDPWGGEYSFTDNGDGTITISTTKAVSNGGLSDEITRSY